MHILGVSGCCQFQRDVDNILYYSKPWNLKMRQVWQAVIKAVSQDLWIFLLNEERRGISKWYTFVEGFQKQDEIGTRCVAQFSCTVFLSRLNPKWSVTNFARQNALLSWAMDILCDTRKCFRSRSSFVNSLVFALLENYVEFECKCMIWLHRRVVSSSKMQGFWNFTVQRSKKSAIAKIKDDLFSNYIFITLVDVGLGFEFPVSCHGGAHCA